jgi:hypothetical protein
MWRIQAKYQTVCPRCRGYIKVGAWIVLDPTYGKKWSHAACPANVRKLARRTDEEQPGAREFKMNFGDGGEVIAMEAI